MSGAFRCGHEKTADNTTNRGLCRQCHNAYHNAYAEARRAKETPEERRQRYRISYLPGQLRAARLRVVHLEREAARLGLQIDGGVL